MLIAYYVGNILKLFWNQTLILQNMVITLNFINLYNTATITHGDAKLHINYFDLLMYFLQVIITIIIFGIIFYVYRFGTVLIQEILENYMRN